MPTPSTNVYDYRKIKAMESMVGELLLSKKKLSNNALHAMKRLLKMIARLVAFTEKKKEEELRERERRKYGR